MPELTKTLPALALRLIDPVYFVSLDDWNKPVLVVSAPMEMTALPVIPARVEITEELRANSFEKPSPLSWGEEEPHVELVIRMRIPKRCISQYIP